MKQTSTNFYIPLVSNGSSFQVYNIEFINFGKLKFGGDINIFTHQIRFVSKK